MEAYPRIYFACHLRHRRDPRTGAQISAHQGSILDHLDERDGTMVGALAQHMGVTAGTMSIHVQRLADKGYLARVADPSDGRRVLLRLTAAGARIKAANSVLDPARVGALLDALDDEERARALSGLELLAEGAQRLGRRPSSKSSKRAS